jgi:hypothetical protein
MATAVGSEMDRADLYAEGNDHSLQISLDAAALVQRPRSEQALYRDRGRGQEICPVPSCGSLLELHRSVSKGLSFAWTRIWGARGEESDLQRRFEFATPPLKIAGLSTAPGSGWRQEVPTVANVGRLILLEAALLDDELANHRGPDLPSPGDREDSPVRRLHRRAFNAQGEPLTMAEQAPEWQRRIWSFFGTGSAQVESTVWWIRHGMTVEKTLHDLDLPGLLVLAPATDLDLDASGYSLVRNEKFQARVTQAGELARKVMGSVTREELLQQMSRPQVLQALVQDGDDRTPPSVESLLAEFPWLAD